MTEPSSRDRGAFRARALSAWMSTLPTRRGFWLAGVLVSLLLAVGNAVEGHWLSVLWGTMSAAICARRVWRPRGTGPHE